MNWGALAAAITVIDVHAAVTGRRTLSSTFRAATRQRPLLVATGTSYLLAHLYGLIPARIDPLRNLTTHKGDGHV